MDEAQKELKFLKLLLLAMPDHVYWKDTENRILGCNENMLRAAGLHSLEDIVGKKDNELPWKVPGNEIKYNDDLVIRTRQPHTFRETFTNATGQQLVMHSHKVPLKDEKGNVIGILGISTDITALLKASSGSFDDFGRTDETKKLIADIHKQVTGESYSAEISIVESVNNIRNYLETIISLMPGNVYWKTKNGFYLGCNDNHAKIFNLHRQDIVGKNDRDLIPPNLLDEVLNTDREIVEKDKPMLLEENGIDCHGNHAVYLSQKVPLHDKQGNVIGILGVSLDITEQKEIEKMLHQAKEAIEAANVAKAANAAKTEFIRNMSHDLRTPLSGIIGMANLIQHETVAEASQDGAKHIFQAGTALMNLLNEIIETVRLESGLTTHEKSCFSLKETLGTLTAMFMPSVNQKSLTLAVHYDDTIPTFLFGEALVIHRIILNLLANAVKFTEKGSITIDAHLVNKEDEIACIEIIVKDTGIGIPRDKFDEIFYKFTRLTPAYANNYQGSGLGLYIVKEFIESLGGTIHVSSELGQGSQFRCTLNLNIPTDEQLTSLKQSQDNNVTADKMRATIAGLDVRKPDYISKERKVPVAAKFHALLVEDTPLPQKMADALLSQSGYAVMFAETAAEALEKSNAHAFDIIYMDVGLPDGSGVDVAKSIRNNPKNPNADTVIVALTAHSDAEIKKQCINAGMQEIFEKPLRQENIELAEAKIQNTTRDHARHLASKPHEDIPRIDLSFIKKISNGSIEDAKELMDELIKELPAFQAEITKFFQKSDMKMLQQHVHKLHGALCYSGALRLKAIACDFDKQLLAQSGNYEQIYKDLMTEIEETMIAYRNVKS